MEPMEMPTDLTDLQQEILPVYHQHTNQQPKHSPQSDAGQKIKIKSDAIRILIKTLGIVEPICVMIGASYRSHLTQGNTPSRTERDQTMNKIREDLERGRNGFNAAWDELTQTVQDAQNLLPNLSPDTTSYVAKMVPTLLSLLPGVIKIIRNISDWISKFRAGVLGVWSFIKDALKQIWRFYKDAWKILMEL